jgi:DNA repair exonuclease SbcCD nuclease subunit
LNQRSTPVDGTPTTDGEQHVVRFVHTADWQLGMRRHFLDEDAQHRFSQDRLDAVAAVGRLAAEAGAAFVVVAGDVFDDNQVDRRTVLRLLDVLRGYPDIPVLLLPGNHDPLDAGSVFASDDFREHCPPQVHVVADAEPIEVADGVEVVGAPWPVKSPVRNPALDVLESLSAPTGVRILLAHGGVDVLGGEFDQATVLRAADLEPAVETGLVHFVALGDRHSATPVGESGRIWFAGAPEPTAYVEDNPGKALLVDVDAEHVQVEQRQVGRWRFRREVFDVAGEQDLDAVQRWLDEPDDKPRTIAKLALRGSLTLRERTRLDQALAEAAETYGALESWQRHADLVTAPDDEDLDAMEVGGFVADAVAELREIAQADTEDREDASDALALLYRTVVRA